MSEDAISRIAGLSPQKRALLLQQLAKQQTRRLEIARRPRPDRIPLSFAQQRLWLLDQLEPGSASYNLPVGVWLRGTLRDDLMERCVCDLVARHETLRTRYVAEEGAPRQIIEPHVDVPMRRADVSGRPEEQRMEAALALAGEEGRQPFNLVTGPVVRALLIRLSASEHLLIINFHHVAMDGWSLSIFYRELAEIYGAYLAEAPSPLQEPALQYADFAMWQREWLQGEVLDKQLAYWLETLGAAPLGEDGKRGVTSLPVLELPSDRPRAAVHSSSGGVVRVTIPRELVSAARQLSGKEGVTLFMIFLSALEVVLYRYSGQSDFLVGSGIANRTRQEIEQVLGCFVNTLPLRADLSGNPTFRELVGRVRESTLGAYAHQDLPVERLVEELNVERSLSQLSIFQVMLFFQNQPSATVKLPGLTIDIAEMDLVNTGTARSDLAFFVADEAGALDMLIEYSSELFDASTVRRLGEHLINLLRGAVASPDARIAELPLLHAREREELLSHRATVAPFPRVTMQRLFEEQVARTPEAPAIAFEGRSVSYRQLNARANALALELQARGARPGQLVGLFAERGIEMVVTLLGILKSGAAYLPLDPSYPADRLAFMIADGGAGLIVTQKHTARDLPPGQAALVYVDAHQAVDEHAPNVDGSATADDVAYVIFTSGSTGKPKGVRIPHKGAVNFLLAMLREPGLSAGDVVCAITTLSFDISVLELFLPLIAGAKVVIGDRATASDGVRLGRFIADCGATIVQATPASWRMLLDSGWEGRPGLKVLCGGEPLTRELADRLLDRVAELWNVYGPTETTVWATVDRVERGAPITVGRPIRNMRMYIVDANLQLVPDGVPGELLIGGVGTGYGYLGRPDLTSDRFIADPFATTAGERLYRTGDVARWRHDGRIEILGRSDNQVKIRGFRIELGEIESALREHAAVKQAVVMAREDRPGDRRLVAYVVPHAEAPQVNDLRVHLRGTLPDYMVPAAFVMLGKLPISPNGKVDRRALPAPELADIETATYVAPRTPEEEQLAQIWQEVLGLERVGIEDDFFALGGHSLLAAQLIARVSRVFGGDVPLRRLFEAPTVATFAEAMLADRVAAMDGDALSALLSQVEGLSDEELQALLGSEGGQA